MHLTSRLNRRNAATCMVERFIRSERGALSVEFAILFSAIMMIVIAFVATSIHIATASDVQQASHDLTRQSLRYVDAGLGEEAVCAHLRVQVLPHIMEYLTFAESERVEGISCSVDVDKGFSAVTVAYDAGGTFISRAANIFGVSVENFTRTARIHL